ncbi:MAG: endonuclease/exonuclease/phosphatase family protein [Rikenellaceae bacterium]|nr:endonuclease/exonuclease/phosphatase family protein [Rikenellaceae bacterium]
MGSRRTGNFLIRIVDLVMFVISIFVVTALVAAYVSPALNPNQVWYLSFFGLFFPVFYLAALIVTFYWACRWSRVFFLTAFVLLLGIGKVTEFYKFPVNKKYHENPVPANTLKIITFNVAGFWDHGREALVTEEILEYIKGQDPDIICIQEFVASKKYPKDFVDRVLEEWEYSATNLKGGKGIKAVTYSKFPIISDNEIIFENKNNGVLYTDLLVGSDTLRIINNHLQTTHVDKDNVKFLDDYHFTFDDETKDTFKQIIKSLKQGFATRAYQADSVASLVHGRNIPTIVCGDFNDTPMSYVYKTIRGNYEDAFVNKGSGFGYTFKYLYRILRIDYVLHSGDIETVSYESPDVQWSDHNPVIVEFKIKES